MAVEPTAGVRQVIGREEEIAVGLLDRDQKLEATPDGVAVGAGEVVVAGAQEAEERQAGSRGVAIELGNVGGSDAGKLGESPAAVGQL